MLRDRVPQERVPLRGIGGAIGQFTNFVIIPDVSGGEAQLGSVSADRMPIQLGIFNCTQRDDTLLVATILYLNLSA